MSRPDTNTPPRMRVIQRTGFFALVALLSIGSTGLFIDLLQRTGLTPAKYTLIAIYAVLTTGLALGFVQFLAGFLVCLTGYAPQRISRRIRLDSADAAPELQSRIALLFPVYNEEPKRVFNGIETVYHALQNAGQLEHFDFFILSDSTQPNRWIEEENEWLKRCNKLQAHGRLIYRHRTVNLNQKSGNVSDFCRRWGAHYDHMICFDADSLMSAECILKLVRLIEANPQVGIIQTMPGLFGAQTLFARLQQFANRVHGDISAAGLNFWQQSEGNYWGHNAIIRLEPFTRSCTLPELPGPKPLGGRVMSHDFVEAALMRKAGYEVWLADDLGGSYEELPPTLLDYAQRDRRWCQGNLQHAWIALFGKIPCINRLHMLNGIYAYLAAPLWLAFLAISTLAAYSWESSGLSLLPRAPLIPFAPHSLLAHGLLIFGITLVMIFLPKLMTMLHLLVHRSTCKDFGGLTKACLSIGIEVFIFTLMAPSMMLFHSTFVFSILTGGKVKWSTQNRYQDTHTTWQQGVQAHAGHTLVGIVWAVIAWHINPNFFYWMSPVLLGWILSIPLSIITSHSELAHWFTQRQLLTTPEESQPPEIIRHLNQLEAATEPAPLPIEALREDFGLMQVILDPYINALHLEFLPPRRNQTAETTAALGKLAEKLVHSGAPALSNAEKNRILNDPRSVSELHRSIWTHPQALLPAWWRLAINRYSRHSLFIAELKNKSA